MNKVTVIVPIYNLKEQIIFRCIDSILNQTYKNIEILIINDGSTNSIQSTLEKYKTNPLIKIFNQENKGVSSVRNLGVSIAQGNWIMFVDGDDYIENNLIEVLLANTTEKTDIIASSCIIDTKDGTETVHFFDGNKVFVTNSQKEKLYKQLMNGSEGQVSKKYYTAIGVPWAKLYKKDFLINNNLTFNTKLKRMQDNIFNMNAFSKAEEVKYIDQCLYHYDFSHMSDFKSNYNPNLSNVIIELIKERYNTMKDLNLLSNEELNEYRLNEKLRFLAQIIIRDILHKKNNLTKKERVKKLEEISNRDEFKELFTQKNKRFAFCHGIKTAGFYTIAKLHMWWLLLILY